MPMILTITGHRPDKLGGYQSNPLQSAVATAIQRKLEELSPELLYTGMAQGVDQWTAACCARIGVPFHAAVPHPDQSKPWPLQAKREYERLLSLAVDVTIISTGPFHAGMMFKRNKWMIDRSDTVLAVWDGTDGGTAHCYNYAGGRGVVQHRIDPTQL